MSNPISSDIDPQETGEWLLALQNIIDHDGMDRAMYILEKLGAKLGSGAAQSSLSTPYVNSVAAISEAQYPGDLALEKKLDAWVRWNAAITVAGANNRDSSLGGHIGSFASSCTLYEVGFNHFFHAKTADHGGDCIYFQGHISPGVYSRAFLEGRLTEEQMYNYRKEVSGADGLSSYPHPWLHDDFWQFPTVSMGLGPISGIYQARFLKYLEARGMAKTANRHVWVYCGDGEMDEPESMGAITRAGREQLDNLIFVINCNMQRLDGLVNGNGKIIQELESSFRGAGWNVIKVVWGSDWEALIEKDSTGKLLERLTDACDGDFQTWRSRGGAYLREQLFDQDPDLKALVADMSDDDLHNLTRGGHDSLKVYAAYKAATDHEGQPTVILTKTVKGFGMGHAGDARNIAHNQKKMKEDELKAFRDFFGMDVSDEQIQGFERVKPSDDAPEIKYLNERRQALGGHLPARYENNTPLEIPSYKDFAKRLLDGTKEGKTMSTTTAFVQLLTALCKDKAIGKHMVPITPDESRTFGMEGMFRAFGIYNPFGQRYEPEDRNEVMFYKESNDGQILQEGINEGGAFSSWLAAATSYSVSSVPMVPFYICYSMFGFQRTADYCWMAGDARARGFLLGATSGRTTLNGEGLQHEDGHSHIMAGLVPNCISYDPTYAYELAVIMWDGLNRMYGKCEDVYYYITMMNEAYEMRAMPEGCEEGIIKGMYCFEKAKKPGKDKHVQLLGSGSILKEVEAGAELLANDFGVTADIWSMTSANELYREAQDVARYNLLHADDEQRVPYVTAMLNETQGPIIASTDYVKLYSEQLRQFMPRRFEVLGADGFGRSDARSALRRHFEIDRHYVAYTALKALVDEGQLDKKVLKEAIKKYAIEVDKTNPLYA